MNDSVSATAGPDPVEHVSGTGVPVRGNEIDTDQILPARFLKAVTFEGLGQFAFFDQRFDSATPEESRDGDGDSAEQRSADHSSDARRERSEGLGEANGETVSGQSSREEAVGAADDPFAHPFNDDRFAGASILVVNSNFGCGSSREHAPQALMRWGIDAIVGESFAEIFAGNCLGLGIPTVTADHEAITALQAWIEDNPDEPIAVSVADEAISYGETSLDVTVDDAQRRALVDGNWDTTALMRQNPETVHETAESLPYVDLAAGDGVGRTVDDAGGDER